MSAPEARSRCGHLPGSCQCSSVSTTPLPPPGYDSWDHYNFWQQPEQQAYLQQQHYLQQQQLWQQQQQQQPQAAPATSYSYIQFPSRNPDPSTSAAAQDQANKRARAPTSASTASANTRPRARRRVNANAGPIPPSNLPPPPAVFGVGPIVDDENSIPRAFTADTYFASISRKNTPKGQARTDRATHLWFFVRGLKDDRPSSSLPEHDPPSKECPSPKEFSHLECRLCTTCSTRWRNVPGQNKGIEKHLATEHGTLWRTTVHQMQLKGWQTILHGDEQPAPTGQPMEAFTIEGFYDRLIKWIAVDDQAIHVVDTPELRDLLLYVGQASISEKDLPHRTKLTDMIFKAFETEYTALLNRVKNAVGRVSFTSDIWSAAGLQSYMAITAHYIVRLPSGRLVLQSDLVAFRALNESHTGVHIAKVFLQVVIDLGCLNKIGMITLDNASNNGTMMEDIARELAKLGIAFDVVGNRIRCFPHVINISVKTALARLTEMPWEAKDILPGDYEAAFLMYSELFDDQAYANALRNDIVGSVRSLVTKCRASDQRRKELQDIIMKGNANGGWGKDHDAMALLQLLKDVDTRWSSTFLMIDRELELNLAVNKLLDNHPNELGSYKLSSVQLEALFDLRKFLKYAHSVQELVSAQKTPTLSLVIPLYEQLISKLQVAKKKLPKLAHVIQASIDKLTEYDGYSRKTKIYNLAIVLNPTMKLWWIRQHWSEEEYNQAKKDLRDAMLEFRRSERSNASATPLTSTPTAIRRTDTVPNIIPSHAARNQQYGLAGFHALGEDSDDEDLSPDSSFSDNSQMTPGEREREDTAEDERAVDLEIIAWEDAGLVGGADLPSGNAKEKEAKARKFAELHSFDMLCHWEANTRVFPTMFRVAMDVLPAQASAVPCERVFSSSKETDTLRRNRLSPLLMEVLQILKYKYRHEPFAFLDDLVCTEEELSYIEIPQDTIMDLISRGEIKTLDDIIAKASTVPA